MMTIRDVVDQIEVQGRVIVRQITDDGFLDAYNVDDVYTVDAYDGLRISNDLEAYADKEIKYIYTITDVKITEYGNEIDVATLVIEVDGR